MPKSGAFLKILFGAGAQNAQCTSELLKNPFIYAETLFKLVIFSTVLKPLISIVVEKSETKPFLCVIDRLSLLGSL